ncbi:MAG: type II toxin-antitoxin system VapB family antitoxin [Deltaproteobacteria bacterium]|nr:type II toxin-antitoxin system VapB family antitoxin [Deltaproteobacteria bacterium]
MATNLALDDKLIETAKEIGKHASKKEAVTAALKEYIQKRKQKDIFKLFQSIKYDSTYNYKQQRKK